MNVLWHYVMCIDVYCGMCMCHSTVLYVFVVWYVVWQCGGVCVSIVVLCCMCLCYGILLHVGGMMSYCGDG